MAVIQYVEKGAGLHDRVAAAGYRLWQRDGVWVADDDAAVQGIIDGYTLDDCRAEVIARIDSHAAALRNTIVGSVSPAEMASWSIKRGEAQAWIAAGDAATDAIAPMLSMEASARGVSTAVAVQKCAAKAQALSALEALISGNAGRHGDAVRELNDFPDVLAYDYSAGWPEV